MMDMPASARMAESSLIRAPALSVMRHSIRKGHQVRNESKHTQTVIMRVELQNVPRVVRDLYGICVCRKTTKSGLQMMKANPVRFTTPFRPGVPASVSKGLKVSQSRVMAK